MEIIGLILLVLLALWGLVFLRKYRFRQLIQVEKNEIMRLPESSNTEEVTPSMVSSLPEPVQRWLNNSGVIGREVIKTVYLKQHLLMKLKLTQQNWSEGTAEQYFNTIQPAFHWQLSMDLFAGFGILGRDKFFNGKGAVLMKLMGLFTVAKEEDNEKINEGALQRYLAEIIWFPSAALSPYITWEAIDKTSARATMKYKGTTGSGIFQFDTNGNLQKFTAMRFMGSDPDSERKKWTGEVQEITEMNGVKIPSKMNITWSLDDGDWTWLKLEIIEIKYGL